tara:strand:- start:409 stop:1248 length:840 start_codon:yes stop_codon:yes gene_type:complete
MSNTAKIALKQSLFLLFVTFSLVSNGQELDSLKSSKKVLDRLELETSLSLLENQEFNSIPGVGLQIAAYAPFFNGGLRLGLGVGFSKLQFGYEFDAGFHRILARTPPYSAQLDTYPFNLDLTLGTDFLRNSPIDLTLDVGARMYVPVYGTYNFDYDFLNYPKEHSFQVKPSINPAVLASLSFKFPLNEKSSLTISYGFVYAFLPVRPKANSESNGFYYQSEQFPASYDNHLEDNIVGIIADPYINLFKQLILELPSNMGGQHSISIGYRHTFGIGKKTE